MSIEKALYVAQAQVIGGRKSRVVSDDGHLELELDVPKALGGMDGPGSNPEQLFAAGYAACFLSAMKYVASNEKIELPDDASIDAHVGIGKVSTGFALEVELKISLPGMNKEQAQTLIDKADVVCPYSNATHENIDVTLTLV